MVTIDMPSNIYHTQPLNGEFVSGKVLMGISRIEINFGW